MIVNYDTDRAIYTTSTCGGITWSVQGTSSDCYFVPRYDSRYNKMFNPFRTSLKPDYTEIVSKAKMSKYGVMDDWSNSDVIDDFLGGFEVV